MNANATNSSRIDRTLMYRYGLLLAFCDTYYNWLSRGAEIRQMLRARFRPTYDQVRFGKLLFLGRRS